jgi:hypothetical protein
MENKSDGGPAFPESIAADMQDGLNYSRNKGMSLRDYFAGQFLSTVEIHGAADADAVATDCYAMADAMLRARAAQSPAERQAAHLDTFGR